jgi:hypothetical protein
MVCCVVGCSSNNSTKSPASGTGKVSEPNLMSQVRSVHVDQCVSAVMLVEAPVFIHLCGSCSSDGGRRTVRFVGFMLKVVMQNEGDVADVILL